MTRKPVTDNYFRVGRNVWLFQTGDLLSIHRAWNAARAASEASGLVPSAGGVPPKRVTPDPVAVYRPFHVEGPWRDCDIIGFAPPGDRPGPGAGDIVSVEGAQELVDEWIERFELRKLLWATGANHVDAAGEPLTGI